MASTTTMTTATMFIASTTLLLFFIYSTYTPSLMQRPPRRSLQLALAPQSLPPTSHAHFPHPGATNSSHNSTRRSHHHHHNVTNCPIDNINVGVCVGVLANLVNVTQGQGFPARYPCCEIVDGLVEVEVAVCLCTTYTVDLFGNELKVSIRLSVLVNFCGKSPPSNFQCPP